MTGSVRRNGVEFEFIGFTDAEVARAESSIAAIRISQEPLELVRVSEATVYPCRALPRGVFSGGVFVGEQPIPEAQILRSEEGVVLGSRIDPQDLGVPQETVGRAIFGGVLFSGYGHVILESLARLWGAEGNDFPILLLGTDRKPSWNVLKQYADLLGIDVGRFKFVGAPIKVRELLVPPAGVVLGISTNAHYVDWLRRKISAPWSHASRHGSEAWCYLSRAGLTKRQRGSGEETSLEAKLLAGGNLVVRPETLTINLQIGLFNEIDKFAGLIGSQFHNLIFRGGERSVKICYLCYGQPNPNFFQIDLLFPGKRVYAHIANFGKFFNFGNRTPFLLDEEKMASALRHAGLAVERDMSGADQAESYAFLWFSNILFYKLFRRIAPVGPEERLAQARSVIAYLRKKLPALTAEEVDDLVRAFDAGALHYRLTDELTALRAELVADFAGVKA